MSWLVGLVVSALMNWLEKFFADHIAAYEKSRADHQKAVDQAAQDNASAAKINEGSKSDDVDQAIDDSFKHL